jgi:hypothetical protein
MAKSKGTPGYAGSGGTKASKPLTSDPPVIIGGGSVNVFFKSNAIEVPSTKPGYRCFKVGGNIKKLAFYNGEDPGSSNLDVKNPKTFFVQAEEV